MRRVLRFIGSLLMVGVALTIWAALADTPTTWLMTPLTVHEQPRVSDVVIVLGSGTKKNTADHLPDQAKDRVITGLSLVASGESTHLIFSGGLDKKTKLVEADVMERYALAHNGHAEDMTLEPASTDTFTNAVNSLAIMSQHHWGTALVVTSPYHTGRACAIFRKLGANVRCMIAPLYTVDRPTMILRLSNFRSVIREYGAWVYNWIRGTV